MTTADLTRFGPFVPALSYPEMICRLRVLRAFCQVFAHDDQPVHLALWLAEQSGEPAEVEGARIEFDRLPALTGRNILCAYAKHWKGPKPPAERKADVAL